MANDPKPSTPATNRQAYEPTSLATYRASGMSEVSAAEAWVRVVILDADGSDGRGVMSYLLGDPSVESDTGTLWVDMSVETIDALVRQYRTAEPWRLLVGHEMDVLLRGRADHDGPRAELVDVGQDWLEWWRQGAHRERLAMLAGIGIVCGQRGLEMHHPVGVVDVLRAEDVSSPETIERLGVLASAGVVFRDVLRVGKGAGDNAIARYLERRITGGTSRPDVVLIVAHASDKPPAFVDDLEVAMFASAVQIPIVLGAPHEPHGSLLHEVVFSAADSAIGAIASLEKLVSDGLKAEKRAQRIREHIRRVGRSGRV